MKWLKQKSEIVIKRTDMLAFTILILSTFFLGMCHRDGEWKLWTALFLASFFSGVIVISNIMS